VARPPSSWQSSLFVAGANLLLGPSDRQCLTCQSKEKLPLPVLVVRRTWFMDAGLDTFFVSGKGRRVAHTKIAT